MSIRQNIRARKRPASRVLSFTCFALLSLLSLTCFALLSLLSLLACFTKFTTQLYVLCLNQFTCLLGRQFACFPRFTCFTQFTCFTCLLGRRARERFCLGPQACIRQHTSAYVSIRQHERLGPQACIRRHTSAYVSMSASGHRPGCDMSILAV